MELASSSKILHNPDEPKEENMNEDSMQGQEDISSAKILHQIMLGMNQESIELLKKVGKKESSFTTEKIPMEEAVTIPRSLGQQGSPSPFSRPMAS
ncbi:hypothetical protein O181_123082 [Austropuccinia psidii MF-1]|uniref:Uncharacterized protein n=1 Tax=Austropuccinia psidii MF-1 TaxID=1389203 RepID=A0A9Q3KPD5_9BASI|nr:hypothetical protein [Austropuccinia psidii MF-1]